jgi:hypothetical protein
VKHQQESLVLVAARNPETLQELDIDSVSREQGWKIPLAFSFTSLEEAKAVAESLNPFQSAGFVAVDSFYQRLEILSRQFVAASSCLLLTVNRVPPSLSFSFFLARGNTTNSLSLSFKKNPGFGPFNLNADNVGEEDMLSMIRSGTAPELVLYFPKWLDLYRRMNEVYLQICHPINSAFREIFAATTASTKESGEAIKVFAEAAKKFEFSTILFSMRNGETNSAQEFFSVSPSALFSSVQGKGEKKKKIKINR